MRWLLFGGNSVFDKNCQQRRHFIQFKLVLPFVKSIQVFLKCRLTFFDGGQRKLLQSFVTACLARLIVLPSVIFRMYVHRLNVHKLLTWFILCQIASPSDNAEFGLLHASTATGSSGNFVRLDNASSTEMWPFWVRIRPGLERYLPGKLSNFGVCTANNS